jgi:WD40 repeat protein
VAASGLDQTVKVWDATTGSAVATLHVEDGTSGVAFSPDGSRIASGTEDRMVMLWAFPGRETRTLRQGGGCVRNVAFSPDGRLLAGACVGKTVIWDVITGKGLRGLPGAGRYGRVAWSPIDNRIAGVPASKITDAITGDLKMTLSGGGKPWERRDPLGYVFSEDGRLVAEASGAKGARRVTVWNATTGQLIHSFQMSAKWAACVAFSPDDKLLAAGAGDGSSLSKQLQVWEVSTGRTVFCPTDLFLQVWGVAFSPDGKLLAAAMGLHKPGGVGTIRVWDTATWQVVHNLRGHSGRVWSLAFSPDGRRLASAGGQMTSNSPPGEVKIWDLTTGQEVWTLPGTKGAVYGVAFSPDGRRLATASGDGTVKVWDGTSLAETPGRDARPAGR